MPYRTFDDRIDGLVITFIDISELKLVEEKLQKMNQENRLLIELLPG
jgi:two-component system, chemotaxis family, CheB/CheR fusion protein